MGYPNRWLGFDIYNTCIGRLKGMISWHILPTMSEKRSSLSPPPTSLCGKCQCADIDILAFWAEIGKRRTKVSGHDLAGIEN